MAHDSAIAPRLPPARLSVVLAREAPTAIVLRRGPSKVVGTFGWNREDDTISVGQWLKGRIYEDACDLSPDGKYFLYSAMNGKRASETQGEWTAFSFAPYLKAIGLWRCPRAFGAGGLFLSNTDYWLSGDDSQILLRMETYGQKLRRLGDDAAIAAGIDLRKPIESTRFIRDGWASLSLPRARCYIWEKSLPHGWRLRRLVGAGGPLLKDDDRRGTWHDEYALVSPYDEIHPHSLWSWADWDPVQSRLVWTSRGKLFAGSVTASGLGEAKELHDFNNEHFEELKAPY